MRYDPNDYRLPLTDDQEIELLALGQAEADAQTLETLLTGGASAELWIDGAVVFGLSIEDAVQDFRTCWHDDEEG